MWTKIGFVLIGVWFGVWQGYIDADSGGIFALIAKGIAQIFGGIPHILVVVGVGLIIFGQTSSFRERKKEKDKRKELGYETELLNEQAEDGASSSLNPEGIVKNPSIEDKHRIAFDSTKPQATNKEATWQAVKSFIGYFLLSLLIIILVINSILQVNGIFDIYEIPDRSLQSLIWFVVYISSTVVAFLMARRRHRSFQII